MTAVHSQTSTMVRSLRHTRSILLPALAVASALTLGGCREQLGLDTVTASTLNSTEARHPIGYSSRTEALYVEVVPGGERLSPNQAADITEFVSRYRIEGTGRLTVAAPGSARGALSASRQVREVLDIVHAAGLPPEAIAEVRHGAKAGRRDGEAGPAVRLAYERPIAVPPQCGDWPEDIGHNRERLPYTNFGCATERNFAVSVATSRDIQMPQEEAPRAGERRTAVWTKYTGASGGNGSGAAAPAAAPAAPAAPKGGAP